jgi:mono/diheme cytochrome c family protein
MQMLSIFAMFVALSGCGQKEAENKAPQAGPSPTAQAEPGKPSAASMEEAKNIYQMRCAICHGPSGKGDGPGAAALDPKPRNYTDKEWQKTVTDDELRQVIVKGGAALQKSPVMPPNPDLQQKPQVLDALIAMIRGFVQS